MTLYSIFWKSKRYGQSSVEAEDKIDAREKALNDEDNDDFEELDSDDDWEIDDIIEVE